jgi:hypothetical protein
MIMGDVMNDETPKERATENVDPIAPVRREKRMIHEVESDPLQRPLGTIGPGAKRLVRADPHPIPAAALVLDRFPENEKDLGIRDERVVVLLHHGHSRDLHLESNNLV